MYIRMIAITLLGTVLASTNASAQQPALAAPNPLDAVPEAMPFNTPYGAPISAAKAQAVIQAAIAEATKRGWPVNIAVVDSGANLVAFVRMDGSQLASIAIAEHKARASVKYRRPTKTFEDGIQLRDLKYIVTLDDVIASRGGIPLAEDGKIIGGIGCSGAQVHRTMSYARPEQPRLTSRRNVALSQTELGVHFAHGRLPAIENSLALNSAAARQVRRAWI